MVLKKVYDLQIILLYYFCNIGEVNRGEEKLPQLVTCIEVMEELNWLNWISPPCIFFLQLQKI